MLVGVQCKKAQVDYALVASGLGDYDLLIIMDYSQITHNWGFQQDGIFTVVFNDHGSCKQEFWHFICDDGTTNDSQFTLTCLYLLFKGVLLLLCVVNPLCTEFTQIGS